MNLNFGIGPVVKGPPASRTSILHLLEDVFDDVLASVRRNNPRIIPSFPAGDDDVFAKVGVRECAEGVAVKYVLQSGNTIVTFCNG